MFRAAIEKIILSYNFNIIHSYVMSTKKSSTVELRQERTWVPCVGDFPILKKFFAQKEGPFWYAVHLFEILLRGYGQIVFANNPLSGLLIIVTMAAVAPGTFVWSAATAVLGLLVSVTIREPREIVENGITVFNPLLVGVMSYNVIPRMYGPFDAFCFLLVFLGAILSVYLARSLRSDKFSCTTWPFHLVEILLIFAFSTQNVLTKSTEPTFEMHNATSETTMMTTTANDAGFYDATDVYINWGMILRGCVLSAPQMIGIESVILGAVMYLAMLICSPTTIVFSFIGAFCGTLGALQLGVDHSKVYSGVWGYNSLLTAAACGGNLLVLNGQTAAVAVMGAIFASLLQYFLESLFINTQLPILALPFIISTSFLIKLSTGKEDLTFPWPVSPISFPEKQRQDYLARCAALKEEEDTLEELELVIQNEKGTSG
ncbi:urea transporter 2-like [Nylanderia fulva]|uniref:urea transporter 2-like n=1 Tax=Nylanderia fulva TaxID=613905 RepID=UPI0010FB4A58|nr:urea transporter 2-like [Nylanderia fulva]